MIALKRKNGIRNCGIIIIIIIIIKIIIIIIIIITNFRA